MEDENDNDNSESDSLSQDGNASLKFLSESDKKNFAEEQRNFIIKQLSEVAKSRAENHVIKDKILHVF